MTCLTEEELVVYVSKSRVSDNQRIERHLEHCEDCRKMLRKVYESNTSRSTKHEYCNESQYLDAMASVRKMLPTNRPDLSNTRLGEYLLLNKIGQGGMGVVYRARHDHLDRIVAIKTLPLANDASNNDTYSARFRNEIRAIAQLDHPNIVRATDARSADGIWFLAMDYVDGEQLASLVQRNGPMEISKTLDVAIQIAEGLQHAHQHGIIHRDVKPQNLMLSSDGRVKLLDLGIARWKSGIHANRKVETENEVIGTSDYMSPEQIAGAESIDERADIYGLGCTLYFLLTSKPPFHGRQGNIRKMLAQTASKPDDIRTLRPDCPQGLASLVHRMIAKSPSDRFDNCGELIRALSRLRVDSNQDNVRAIGWLKRPVLLAAIAIMGLTVAAIFLSGLNKGEPKANAVNQPTLPFHEDVDRNVALWAFGIGAQRVSVRTSNGIFVETENRYQLPDEYHVEEIDFRHIKSITNQELHRLEGLQHLRQLILLDTSVDDEGLKLLARLPSLEHLDVSILPGVTANGLHSIKSLPNLHEFSLWKSEATVPQVRQMADMAELTRLSISTGTLTDEELQPLSRLSKLQDLQINPSSLDGRFLRYFAGNPNLRRVLLSSDRLSVKGISAIQGLENLEQLNLDQSTIGFEHLRQIVGLKKLTHIFFDGADLDDSSAELFTQIPTLKRINIRNSPITDDFLRQVPMMESLVYLDLTGTAVTDVGLEYFHSKPMNRIHLEGTAVTQRGVANLRHALPNCRVSSDFD